MQTLLMRIPLKSASAMFQGQGLPSLASTPHDGPYMCQTRSQTSPAPPSVVPLSGEHVLCTQKKMYHNLPKPIIDTPWLMKGFHSTNLYVTSILHMLEFNPLPTIYSM